MGQPRACRTSRITENTIGRIDKNLRKGPHYFSYRQHIWDGILIRKHLSDHYGIDMGVRQYQNIFHMFGFWLRRPRPMIAKADE